LKYPYILFDLDGTLIDSHEAICRSLNDTLRHFGLKELPFSQSRKYIGTPLPEVMMSLGIDPKEGIQVYRPFYFSYLEKYQIPYEGIDEALQKLSVSARLSVATNKGRNGTDLSLKHAGLSRHFQFCLTEADVDHTKPHPRMFEKTVDHYRKQGHSPERSQFIMVGDSPVDGDFAFNSGIPFAFASWGFYDESDLNRNPDVILVKPSDLSVLSGE
jgi:phosphoglycolate phosphatase-like HAD superfamily hydrolase